MNLQIIVEENILLLHTEFFAELTILEKLLKCICGNENKQFSFHIEYMFYKLKVSRQKYLLRKISETLLNFDCIGIGTFGVVIHCMSLFSIPNLTINTCLNHQYSNINISDSPSEPQIVQRLC